MSGSGKRRHQPRDSFSRRDFVRISALAAGGAAVGACGSSPTDNTDPDPFDPDLPDPDPEDVNATVAAVTGLSLSTMAREVLEPLGGIGAVVGEGESVFIKPNMVTLPWAGGGNVFSGGECTKPEIVVAVAEQCLEAGAREVIIGDGSHAVELNWAHARTLDGSANLASEAARLSGEYGRSVRCASLEADSPSWPEVPSDTYLEQISVSSLVADADRVISIPVAKTHSWAQLTLSLKNFIGITPLWRYGDLPRGIPDRGVVFDHSSPQAIAAIYLDIVKGVQPDLAIIDFSVGIEGNGPNRSHGGTTVDVRNRLGSYLLLASTDLVAADATAARIMSHSVSNTAQLTMGFDMGLGEIRQEHILLVGAKLSELNMPWRQAQIGGQQVASRAGCPGSAVQEGHAYG